VLQIFYKPKWHDSRIISIDTNHTIYMRFIHNISRSHKTYTVNLFGLT
jgi:hypothetical protein